VVVTIEAQVSFDCSVAPSVARAFQASESLRSDARLKASRYRMALSSGGLREELQRVDQFAVREDLVVHVRAGRSTGRSDVADHVAAPDVLTGLHRERAQVTVARRQSESVVELNEISDALRSLERVRG